MTDNNFDNPTHFTHLQTAHSRALHELELMALRPASEQRSRLLFLFLVDRLKGRGFDLLLLQQKDARDHKELYGRRTFTRREVAVVYVGRAVLVVAHACMLVYTVQFALLQSSQQRRNAWVTTLAVWAAVEVVVNSTLVALWTHAVVPLYACSGVTRMKDTLCQDLTECCGRNSGGETTEFNAAAYFFISVRVVCLLRSGGGSGANAGAGASGVNSDGGGEIGKALLSFQTAWPHDWIADQRHLHNEDDDDDNDGEEEEEEEERGGGGAEVATVSHADHHPHRHRLRHRHRQDRSASCWARLLLLHLHGLVLESALAGLRAVLALLLVLDLPLYTLGAAGVVLLSLPCVVTIGLICGSSYGQQQSVAESGVESEAVGWGSARGRGGREGVTVNIPASAPSQDLSVTLSEEEGEEEEVEEVVEEEWGDMQTMVLQFIHDDSSADSSDTTSVSRVHEGDEDQVRGQDSSRSVLSSAVSFYRHPAAVSPGEERAREREKASDWTEQEKLEMDYYRDCCMEDGQFSSTRLHYL